MSNHTNKPEALRRSLSMKPATAGQALLKIEDATLAYDTWRQLERKNKERDSLGTGMRQYLELLAWMRDNYPRAFKQWVNKKAGD